jgi:hypothetical protein
MQRVRQAEHRAAQVVPSVSRLAGGEEGVDNKFLHKFAPRYISAIDHQEHIKFDSRCHKRGCERKIRSMDDSSILKLVGMVRKLRLDQPT